MSGLYRLVDRLAECLDLVSVIFPGAWIHDRDRRRDNKSRCSADRCGGACCPFNDAVAKALMRIGDRLALGEARADQLYDLRTFCKCIVVQDIGCMNICEIHNLY